RQGHQPRTAISRPQEWQATALGGRRARGDPHDGVGAERDQGRLHAQVAHDPSVSPPGGDWRGSRVDELRTKPYRDPHRKGIRRNSGARLPSQRLHYSQSRKRTGAQLMIVLVDRFAADLTNVNREIGSFKQVGSMSSQPQKSYQASEITPRTIERTKSNTEVT